MVLSLIRVFAIAVAVISCTTSNVLAQTIVDRSYTWEKLDAYWGRTLGSAAPTLQAFEPLSPAAPEVPAAVPAGNDFDVPIFGDVIGDNGTSGDDSTDTGVRFPVIPLEQAIAGPLMRRLAWAELYLGRYRAYEAISTDPAEALQQLESRQWAAMLEVYLSHARLYFSAATLQNKCLRVRRLREVAAILPETIPALPEAWRSLWPIVQSVKGRIENEPLASFACDLSAVKGRAETVRQIEQRVQANIALAARDKVQENLTLLNQAASEFQALVNAMDVEIKTAEILELEREFGNAASTLRMVAEDGLGADVTIGELNDIDLSTLAKPGESRDMDEAQEQMSGMVASIDAVLTAISTLSDAGSVADFSACEQLAGLYPTLDLTRDTGALTAEVELPYNGCLDTARQLVEARQSPSLEAVLLAEFARQLAQLSEVYIASISQ